MPILSILLAILTIGVLIWGARSLTAAFGVGEPLATVIMVVVVLICLIFAVGQLGGPQLIRW